MINNYLIPEFGQKPLPTIGPGDLTYFFEKARRGKRKKYLLNLYSLLRVMFEVAEEHDGIERSPVRRKLHRPYGADVTSKKKPALSREEIQRVLLLDTGRVSNAVHLCCVDRCARRGTARPEVVKHRLRPRRIEHHA